MRFCSQCGGVRDDMQRFCSKCGTPALAQHTSDRGSFLKFIGISAIIFGGFVVLGIVGALNTRSLPYPSASGPSTSGRVLARVNHEGDTVVVGNTLCGSTPAALDEMLKWALRGDKEEAARVAIRTLSTATKAGDAVKILDLGFMHTKIRILRTGRECWVVSEVARRFAQLGHTLEEL